MAKAYTRIIGKPTEMPEWLTGGPTILLPKTEETKNPKNYRPITCLPTMYKVLKSILADRTYAFLSEHQLLPSEQKGCRRERKHQTYRFTLTHHTGHPLYPSNPKTKESSVRLRVPCSQLPRVNTQCFKNSFLTGFFFKYRVAI